MKIPFAPPRIDDKSIAEVVDTLKSGWITTGPKTKRFEDEIAEYTNAKAVLCLNSATAGLELALRWFGVGPGDEVIIPAYTYCATANVVEHVGAKVVMVDVDPATANMDVEALKRALTPNTKAVIPVDIAGYPCDYSAIKTCLADFHNDNGFKASGEQQEKLGRILLMSDAAHSFGARYMGKKIGGEVDIMVFSFHAVKNLTTAEGGAMCINLNSSFDCAEVYKNLRTLSLHGQSKDAFNKMVPGAWRYDVAYPGYKCNMTDIQAALGLVELSRYETETLPKRKEICQYYHDKLKGSAHYILPDFVVEGKLESSYHLYRLRISGAGEKERDAIITELALKEIAVNVHFLPLPMLSYYEKKGYDICHYPEAYKCFHNEISLPVYYDLSREMQDFLIEELNKACQKVMG